MSATFKKIQIAVSQLGQLPEFDKSAYYDNELEPLLRELAEQVEAEPKKLNLKEWLYVQSAFLNYAVEGVSELTFTFYQKDSVLLRNLVKEMPLEQRLRLQTLFNEFEGVGGNASPDQVITPLLDDVAAIAAGIYAHFVGRSVLQSPRGFPVAHGTLTLLHPDRGNTTQYTVNSGGGAKDFISRNGPLPPGTYRVSNHRPNRNIIGMMLEGVGYSFDLDPTNGTPVYGRSLFRIHPDGGHQGTNGCIGIREKAVRLRECEQEIVTLLKTGSFNLTVHYI